MAAPQAHGLSAQRRRRAAALVRAVEGRPIPVAVEPEDAPRGEPASESVLVAAPAPDGGSLLARVDLGRESVDVVHAPVRLQLSARERRAAERVALGDPAVVEFLAGRDARPLTRLWLGSEGKPVADRDRLAIVFLRPSAEERRYAVVDVPRRRMVQLVAPT